MSKHFLLILVLLLLLPARPAILAEEADLVAIRSVDRTIMVDLRYATARNIARRPLYPANMPALVRPEVALQLAKAQSILRDRGYGLKIWDAYRPKSAHDQLWALTPNTDYLQDPKVTPSLHTYGVAVDVTLVDNKGRNVAMPTDFDDFSMAAMLVYSGESASVRRHLFFLQNAMARAGFYGLRTEWWHFISKSWQKYEPIPEITIVTRGSAPAPAQPRPPAVAASVPQMQSAAPNNSSPPASASNRATRQRSAGQ